MREPSRHRPARSTTTPIAHHLPRYVLSLRPRWSRRPSRGTGTKCDSAPIRAAVISDIHSNLPALEAVVRAARDAEVDQIWCLGDLVGYGASPDECVALIREEVDVCLLGNHDLAVIGVVDGSTFSPAAAAAVEWTRSAVSAETLSFLGGLEPSGSQTGIDLHHASPRDPVWEYVLGPEQAAECIAEQRERVCLVGHSHLALFFTMPEPSPEQIEMRRPSARVARGAGATHGTRLEIASGRWLLNPGSIGQPRDGDPRASWLLLDTDAWTADYGRIPYDVESAASAISAIPELPGQLARRLYVGQ